MADKSEAEIRERLFKAIRKQRDGMLGLSRAALEHPQPMTTYLDPDQEGPLYFFARNDSDLVKAVEDGATDGLYVFVDEDRKLFASFIGTLTVSQDRQVIDEYFNPIVSAWYPEGKDDDSLRVLTFSPSDAQVWVSDQGPARFLFEVAKANVTKQEPDVGQRANLTF